MPLDKEQRAKLLSAMGGISQRPIRLMEVCGTHTMAIARAGIKSMLPENVSLLSGPGCPVCVTAAEQIDRVLELSMEKGICIASYGDMLRVPGSRPGDSLLRRRALGAQVEIVYSPMDALELAKKDKSREIVFLGIGFETSAPGTAAALLSAAEQEVENFSVLSMLKSVEPGLRALIEGGGLKVDGFLCPGHVASVVGEWGFEFLPRDYGLPAVIGGFEPDEILIALFSLLKQLHSDQALVENRYRRAVSRQGNELALAVIEECFELRPDIWRGLGSIDGSGFEIAKKLEAFDAEKKFGLEKPAAVKATACRCGDVICGRISPEACPMFGGSCTPEDPVGPCMVSSEGACAAAYKYGGV